MQTNSRTSDGPSFPKFRWYDCTDAAITALASEAMGAVANGPTRGRSLKDIETRLLAINRLVAAMAAAGPQGVPVQIAEGNGTNVTARYPKGYREALKHLRDGGWVRCIVEPNPRGDWELYDRGQGITNRPNSPRWQRGKPKGSPGCFSLTEKAWATLDRNRFDCSRLLPDRNHSIEVKDSNKQLVRPLPDHPNLGAWLQQLDSYNKAIRDYSFHVGDQSLKPCEFFLWRVFNNQGYADGGRFYSYFVNRPSGERRLLTIDGERVCSADFKNLHARLSLAIVGQTPTDDDLYFSNRFERDSVKAAWSAALNANNSTGYTDAIESREIVKQILCQYPRLTAVFGQGYGLKLQRADAEVVSATIDVFHKAKRPIVPCHDGFYFLEKDKGLFLESLSLGVSSMFGYLRDCFPETNEITLPVVFQS